LHFASYTTLEALADRCHANGWRIEPHSQPHFVKSYSCAAALGS
jgi:hypothetical protein